MELTLESLKRTLEFGKDTIFIDKKRGSENFFLTLQAYKPGMPVISL